VRRRGTRLWPASRENRPKQFQPLFGTLSTFQETMRRVADPGLFARPIVVTNGQYRFLVAEQLAAIGAEADILLEPARRVASRRCSSPTTGLSLYVLPLLRLDTWAATVSSINRPAARRLAMRMRGRDVAEIEIHRLLFFFARRRPMPANSSSSINNTPAPSNAARIRTSVDT
jgi:hypothetical protein